MDEEVTKLQRSFFYAAAFNQVVQISPTIFAFWLILTNDHLVKSHTDDNISICFVPLLYKTDRFHVSYAIPCSYLINFPPVYPVST